MFIFHFFFIIYFFFNFLTAVGGDGGGKGVEEREETSVGEIDLKTNKCKIAWYIFLNTLLNFHLFVQK